MVGSVCLSICLISTIRLHECRLLLLSVSPLVIAVSAICLLFVIILLLLYIYMLHLNHASSAPPKGSWSVRITLSISKCVYVSVCASRHHPLDTQEQATLATPQPCSLLWPSLLLATSVDCPEPPLTACTPQHGSPSSTYHSLPFALLSLPPCFVRLLLSSLTGQ